MVVFQNSMIKCVFAQKNAIFHVHYKFRLTTVANYKEGCSVLRCSFVAIYSYVKRLFLSLAEYSFGSVSWPISVISTRKRHFRRPFADFPRCSQTGLRGKARHPVRGARVATGQRARSDASYLLRTRDVYSHWK